MHVAIVEDDINMRKSLEIALGGKSRKTEDLQTWINDNKDKFKGLDTNLFDKELNLNTELAKSILDNYGDKLVGQTKEIDWFSEDKLKNLRDYKEIQEAVWDAYIDKIKEAQAIYQNQSGGGWFTNPWNSLLGVYDSIYGTSIFGHDYEKGTTAAINNLRIETRKKSKGFLGSAIVTGKQIGRAHV